MIRLQTAKRRDIPNSQGTEISAFELNWSREIPKRHSGAQVLGPVCPRYNCHGLTFASRRTKICDASLIREVLADDGFDKVDQTSARAGDVVIYSTPEGDVAHSGLVAQVQDPFKEILVWSKWGNGPEVLHSLLDVPSIYGKTIEVFRARCPHS